MGGFRGFIFSIVLFPIASMAYIGGKRLDFTPATVGLSGQNGAGCTGVVVALNKILMAAHCNNSGGFGAGTTVSLLDAEGNVLIQTGVIAFKSHPTWSPDHVKNRTSYDRYFDLAILEVEDTFIIPMAQINLKPLVLGSWILVGGFGCKGDPNGIIWPGLTGAFKKIERLGKTEMTVGFNDADLKAKSMGCPGDSGGPAYVYNSETKTYEVIGINRAVFGSEAVYIDTLTGKTETYGKQMEPKFYITIFDKNLFGVHEWLRQNLPAASFR